MSDSLYVLPSTMPHVSSAMKVTTVRFGTDLWALLEHEAELAGVSVSQYIREAALTRATASAVARGEPPYELLAGAFREAVDGGDEERRRAGQHVMSALARLTSTDARADTKALRNQSEQARRTAETRHARANELTTAPRSMDPN